jgi:hypothetical protein
MSAFHRFLESLKSLTNETTTYTNQGAENIEDPDFEALNIEDQNSECGRISFLNIVLEYDNNIEEFPPGEMIKKKRPRGRPPGSKNKPKKGAVKEDSPNTDCLARTVSTSENDFIVEGQIEATFRKKRGRGRPPGSKNKLKKGAVAEGSINADQSENSLSGSVSDSVKDSQIDGPPKEKRGPGRPKGSRNKKTLARLWKSVPIP